MQPARGACQSSDQRLQDFLPGSTKEWPRGRDSTPHARPGRDGAHDDRAPRASHDGGCIGRRRAPCRRPAPHRPLGREIGPVPDSVLGELIRATTAPNAANGVDVPPRVALPPEAWTGWTGTPGLRGHRMGDQWSPQFVPTDSSVEQHARGGGGLSVSAVDLITDLRLGLILELLPTGLLRARASVTSLSGEPYVLDGLDLAFPGPARAEEILDLAGRWAKERLPQRASFDVGARVREGRHGHRTRAVPAGSAILLR
ncbi:hypothetical protein DOU07_15305 [Clavibacter michiganensis subsp. michiganensis]|nr:hypothetical protein [Clavibacter michiganensis subsp. michiganensis]MWJ39753.1 hypothetical protein [Clavibacter michiganensis subsp. michiganensis]MWJ42741.1 hypothetical protein [Clavibacter michiganensis subsp. michiganensis]MWJ68877.1 hypothetical protein [Clavibacter michiganensis subsp. michiganensis]MWJ83693.1 hypothetical protein [Clavibacter michiganensis subsp. michiganensis]